MQIKKKVAIFIVLIFLFVNILPINFINNSIVEAIGTSYVNLNFDTYNGSKTSGIGPTGWSIYNTVANTNYIIGEAVSPRSDKSMKFYTSGAGNSMSLAKTGFSFGSQTYGFKVVLEANVYFDNTDVSRQLFQIKNGSLAYETLVTFDSDASIKINIGAPTNVTLPNKYNANTWYNIRIFLDGTGKTFDVYMNGSKVADQIPLLAGWNGALANTLKITQVPLDGKSGAMYFDDFNIYDFIPVSDISIDSSASVPMGTKINLAPVITPGDASNKSVNWTSSDEAIATVDNTGCVTGVKTGSTVITATTADGNKSASCTVEVQAEIKSVESISIDQTAQIFIGETQTLTPVIAPSDATNKAVSFQSSDSNTVKVDNTGVITGIKEGSAVITVTTKDGNKSATCNVQVFRKLIDSISIDSNISIQEGKTIKLNPVILPVDASNKNIIWSSSNDKIAYVDDSGRVRGIAAGSADVTATTEDGNKVAVCRVNVTPLTYNYDEYDIMRNKWRDSITGGDYDQNNQSLNNIAYNLGPSAQALWDKMNKSEDRVALWDNIPAATQSAPITTSYKNLLTLAKAFSTKGSPLYGNIELLNDISDGLDWMYTNKYHENMLEYGNWWDWEIGVPVVLNDIVVLLYDYLSDQQIANYMNTIYYFQPDPDKSGARDNTPANINRKAVGGNRIDVSKVAAIRGIIVKDSNQIAAARDALSDVFYYVSTGDGFYKDGSFIQHDTVPYTGTYGNVVISGLGLLLDILNGTTWEVKDSSVNNVYDAIINSFEPLLYKGAMMDMVRGRAITRPSESDRNTGHAIINSIIQLAEVAPEPYASKFKSMAKYLMQQDTYRDHLSNTSNIDVYKKAKAILDDISIIPRGEMLKHKIFPNMDRVVHLGKDFGFGISMFSNRITNFESMNGENLKGWYTSSGMSYLYNSDLAQYTENYWNTVNPYRLPGTTVDTILKNSGVGMKKFSTKNWVGGTSILGLYGATGMELQDVDTTLTAKKSWFNFDDEIVALGSGINSTDNRIIETTIENRKLNDAGDNALIVNGSKKSNELGWSENIEDVKWAHLKGNVEGSDIGYYFPESPKVNVLRESRTGNWADVGSTKNLPDVTKNYLTMWFDHGTNPVDSTYEYVILPNKTSTETESYANNPNISIIKNTSLVQAVKQNRLNILAANFWTDSVQSADYITVNKKASVMVQETNDYMEVSVSDPTMSNNGAIEVELNRAGYGEVLNNNGIVVTQLQPTIKFLVNTNEANGKTFNAKFRLKNPNVTGVLLNKTSLELQVGDKLSLIETIVPDSAENKKVVWESNNKNVASVDENGQVTGISEGDAVITVTTLDGNYSAKCEVRVIKSSVAIREIIDNITGDIIQSINNLLPRTNLTVNISNNTKIEKAIFEAMKSKDIVVSFVRDEVQWIFNGKDINSEIKDLDLSIEVADVKHTNSTNKDAIAELTKDKNPLVISFAENGKLPGMAKVRVKLNENWLKGRDKNNIYIYYYNASEKKAELVASKLKVDENGYVEFNISHNSDYFALDNELLESSALPKTGSLFDTNLLQTFGILTIFLGTLFIFIEKRKNK